MAASDNVGDEEHQAGFAEFARHENLCAGREAEPSNAFSR